MSILINGINMPHDGEFKHIRIYDNGDVTVEFWDGEEVIAHASSVPEHGRLIDADKITEHKYATIPPRRKEYADGKPKSSEEIIAFKFGWNYAIDAIVENAPTIIPADDKDINVLDKERARMAEYIEREAALSAQNKSMNLSECRKRLERIPAADVRPVVRGKWIVKTDADGKTYGVCSECGYEQYAGHLKFCPNCGARMVSEDDEA